MGDADGVGAGDGAAEERSPRERYLTVFGRQPVLEALGDPALVVAQVFVADDVEPAVARGIRAAAQAHGVEVKTVNRARVTRLSGTGKQHQGVAADIETPHRSSLESWLEQLPAAGPPIGAVLLDGVTTPANVGMIIRVAVAAGLHGIVVPSRGVADIGPLVIKASAGVAFRAPLLRVREAEEAAGLLGQAGFDLVALSADAGEDLWSARFAPRTALVLGGEHGGLSDAVATEVTRTVRIPMANNVESLNVATAAAVACFEWMRQMGEVSEVSEVSGVSQSR
ncbi:MAG TPA: RNA methyltransferase [Acidimicrobiales bacterium]